MRRIRREGGESVLTFFLGKTMATAKFDNKTGVISFGTDDGYSRQWGIPDFANLPVQIRDLVGIGAALIGRNVAAISKDAREKLVAKGKDVSAVIREKLDAVVDQLERGEYEYSARAGGAEVGESTKVLVLALQILRRRSIAAGKKPEGSDGAEQVLAEYKALPANGKEAEAAGNKDALTRADIRGGAAYKAAVVQARKELGLDDESDSGGF
jgi:hypothetical protein